MSPTFSAAIYSYTATTSNATNTVTATATKTGAAVSITVNGVAHTSGAAATWLTGKNTVSVTVTFGTTTKTYTVIVTKSGTLGALTVASEAGTESGDTKVTVTETLTAGCKYVYKTGATVDLPALDADLSTWTAWNGTADITATTGNEIAIAEASIFDSLAKGAGKATVTAKA